MKVRLETYKGAITMKLTGDSYVKLKRRLPLKVNVSFLIFSYIMMFIIQLLLIYTYYPMF